MHDFFQMLLYSCHERERRLEKWIHWPDLDGCSLPQRQEERKNRKGKGNEEMTADRKLKQSSGWEKKSDKTTTNGTSTIGRVG